MASTLTVPDSGGHVLLQAPIGHGTRKNRVGANRPIISPRSTSLLLPGHGRGG